MRSVVGRVGDALWGSVRARITLWNVGVVALVVATVWIAGKS